MKRFERILTLLLLVAGAMLFSACSHGNDEPGVPTPTHPTTNSQVPTSKTISVGASFSIGTGSWRSSNDFVASVDAGSVKANHVGECTISNGKNTCKVTVTPNSNFITEPITEWGISKSQLIAKCGNNYKTSGKSIAYISTSNTIAPITMYTFDDNDKLKSSVVTVKTNYTAELVEFLTERYQLIAMEGYDFYFANGNTTNNISTAVGVSKYEYDKSYWLVLYIPYGNSSRCSTEAVLTNDLYDIINL